jgi:hypothetical protein
MPVAFWRPTSPRMTARAKRAFCVCDIDFTHRRRHFMPYRMISGLIILELVEMMVAGNRKPYALEYLGHLSTLCRRQAPVADPSGYFGLPII